jgi:hypothetical protein
MNDCPCAKRRRLPCLEKASRKGGYRRLLVGLALLRRGDQSREVSRYGATKVSQVPLRFGYSDHRRCNIAYLANALSAGSPKTARDR